MNILKHMEAVFIAAAAFAIGGSYLADRLPQAHARAPVEVSASGQTPVVVIKAKRMSAEEKRQSLQAERSADDHIAGVHNQASRI